MTLQEFFQAHPRVAVAFSGGVDSSYVLYAAMQWATDVQAYFVKSAFQPQFELDDASRMAEHLGANMRVLTVDVLANAHVTANPPDRCYFCKRAVFGAILSAAAKDGYEVILDGTNASDSADDRPGMRALREYGVLSPLRECGLTKADVRRLSRAAGLFTWDKPSYACLATRVPTGEPITQEKLQNVEAAEGFLAQLGFKDFRVRLMPTGAKLELSEAQLP